MGIGILGEAESRQAAVTTHKVKEDLFAYTPQDLHIRKGGDSVGLRHQGCVVVEMEYVKLLLDHIGQVPEDPYQTLPSRTRIKVQLPITGKGHVAVAIVVHFGLMA